MIEIEEAAFILKITPRKIASESHIGFIHAILATRACGQAHGGEIGISAKGLMPIHEDRLRLNITDDDAVSSGERTRLACSLRRLAAIAREGKVRDGEGAIASTRGACAPQICSPRNALAAP